MFSFLGFIFIIILVVLLFGISIIGTVVRSLFGFGRRTNPGQQSRNNNTRTNTQQKKESFTDFQNKDRKKVFGKDDGEYVDFEEL
ncbi:DUF4834 family protein [Bacteroides sp. 519]|uniref:DUF4834 family protein n=1 Tax=Bacteroides sp. 519 TaxID=2302937 RepID=UPI0013D7B739|nr:DUF4834 family protein [Bacteroides sp. 519]NDV58910.1 DUF4834 family protein [Bacteroides sp. 519]